MVPGAGVSGRDLMRDNMIASSRRVRDLSAWPQWLLVLVSLAIGLTAWQLLVTWFRVPVFVVPPPTLVLTALREGLLANPTTPESFIYQLEYTLMEAGIGFAIGSAIGLAAGTAIAQSRLAEKVLFPYLVGIQSMPKLAIAPLLLIWFGFGAQSKIVLVALIVFFPVMINAIAGFATVDRDRIDLLRVLAASPWQRFTKVAFPSALPFIMAGLDVGIVESVVAAIIGEFVGGQRGLGVYLLQLNLQLDTAGVFAIILVLSAVGIAAHVLLTTVSKRVVFWTQPTKTTRRIS